MPPCQRSITVGLETPTPAITRPGASEASVWNPIASSPTGRVDIGTTPVPIATRSVATAIAVSSAKTSGPATSPATTVS